jgi:hypothetical protein
MTREEIDFKTPSGQLALRIIPKWSRKNARVAMCTSRRKSSSKADGWPLDTQKQLTYGLGESCPLHPEFVAMTICRAFLVHPVRKSVAAPFLLLDSLIEEFTDAKRSGCQRSLTRRKAQ